MSSTIRAGGLLVLDPSDKRVLEFDWGSDALADGVQITASAWTITAIQQSGVTALTNDNSSYSAADQTTETRLLATTATDGDRYYVENKVTTDETPAQEIEQGFTVLIQNRR